MINALSFDIEEWFHLLNISEVADTDKWQSFPKIVEPYTHQILETLERFNVRATFFIVGWVANEHPLLVKEIAKHGHEIASHSYWHSSISHMNRNQFSEDIHRSIDTLQQLTGKKILGFRAPGFELTNKVDWVFDELLDNGIKYDASLLSGRLESFSCSFNSQTFIKTPSGRLILELPVSSLSLGKLSFPYCGGGYMRLMPQPLLNLLMKWKNINGISNISYLHPRDFAINCPRLKLSLVRRFRTYYGIPSTQNKLEFMLREFQWDCCAAVVDLIPTYCFKTEVESQPA